MILGGGPNRIGQGIEFDYCCVHGVMGLAEEGFETIMINCNPETVSTDYDTTDKLYFEPLTLEDVLNICEQEKPEGVIVSFGGQTPLKIAKALEANGVRILGTSTEGIDLAEDRKRFGALLDELEDPLSARTGRRFDLAGALRSPNASAIRCSSALRTSSADGPWRSVTTTTGSGSTWRRR